MVCKKLISVRKIESFLEKNILSPTDSFSSKWKLVRKRESLQDEGIDLNLAFKDYYEFHEQLHKDLEMLILVTPILLLTKVIVKSSPM